MDKKICFPVILFTFTRLDTLKKTINSLEKCNQSAETDLIIYSDSGKNDTQIKHVKIVREYLSTISGFKSIKIINAAKNKGLAKSIIEGVNEVLSNNEAAIILEDDLIVSESFLTYMNNALYFYKNHEKIISISAYSPVVKMPIDYQYDIYFAPRSTSWGWGTWATRWKEIDWNINSQVTYNLNFFDKIKLYNLGFNLPRMLKKQKKGKIDSWAIRFLINQFKKKTYSVFPTQNLIENIGFGSDATHTNIDKGYNKLKESNNSGRYLFPENADLNEKIMSSFRFEYSLGKMILNKIKLL